ncbi:MAG: cobalt-zinc-cadmium resistance protein [Deltaproteobacteria bacterium]|nr:cobalt-zinc-cadmium resistance protein [Deltaproteobacteria bacterium]
MSRVIAWFATNPIAANLLMGFVLIAGLVVSSGLYREEFPDISPGIIQITVAYPGGAPAEIEESICVRIEESLDGAEGVEHIRSLAIDDACRVSVELLDSADPHVVLADINGRIDTIERFPENAEKPIVDHIVVHIPVIDLSLSGNASERTLKRVGKRLRDELLALPGVTQVELHFARPYEIAIEVSEKALRRYGLSFDEVAGAIRRSSLDLPGGKLRARDGQIRLRTTGQAYWGRDFERLILLTDSDGSEVALGDVAQVVDGFEERDLEIRIDGEPAVMVRVLRVGRQDALDIRERVGEYLAQETGWLPEGIRVGIWLDHSEEIRERLGTLFENALLGLALVLTVLALFLRFRLAFWVAAGLPIVFLGALTLFPWLGFSLNTITVMSFILALGIVVDDAIVVGENIYSHQQRGVDRLRAAIEGTQEVYVPVIFGVLTTMAAFAPLILVGGNMTAMFSGIGVGVMACLVFSIIESQWILPAHLASVALAEERPTMGLRNVQERVSGALERFVVKRYRPLLERAIQQRYMVLAASAGLIIFLTALLASGRIAYEFIPPVEGDHVSAVLKMAPGTSMQASRAIVEELERSAQALRLELEAERTVEEAPIVNHVISAIGTQPFRQMLTVSFAEEAAQDASSAEVTLALSPSAQRSLGAHEISDRWRQRVSLQPEVTSLVFSADMFNAGRAIDIQLRGADLDTLEHVAREVRARLEAIPGVIDLQDSFSSAQREIELRLRPEARPLGLTLQDLARQVRQAFYGEEVQRIQRGVDEVRVMVRYPLEERRSLTGLDALRVRTRDGAEVPLSTVAQLMPRRALPSIRRVDRTRVVNVAADVDRSRTTPARATRALEAELPELLAEFPGVSYRLEGAQQEDAEASTGLLGGFLLALAGIYALLAIPLRSYVQPLIIMSVIPFGALGAILGHLVLRMPLTFFSVVGMVALAGVVVNASLMLVHFRNRLGQSEMSPSDAILAAGQTRFRPILLTSLTTFAGLLPLILERSMPLQTMVPMAVSLASGVLLSTVFTLVLVPCEMAVLEDLQRRLVRVRAPLGDSETSPQRG